MLKRYFVMVSFLITAMIVLNGCFYVKQSPNKIETKKEIKPGKQRNDFIKPNLISIDDPVYSLDDKFIFFSGRYKKRSAIFRINADGTELKKLTEPFGFSDYNPIILSNKKILFSSFRQRTSCADLCTMNMDGTNPIWLSQNGTGGYWKDSSADGKTLFFVSSCLIGDFSANQYTTDIYAMESDGTKRRKITDFKDFFIRHLSVSPDGKLLLFQRESFKKFPRDESMWILPINEKNKYYSLKPKIDQFLSNYKTLKIKNKEHWTKTFSNMNSPKFSPDGNSIVFVWPGHYQGYFGHELYLMDIKSESTEKLTDLQEFTTAPSFSNDGKKIIFTVEKGQMNNNPHFFELWQVNIDGTGLGKINISN